MQSVLLKHFFITLLQLIITFVSVSCFNNECTKRNIYFLKKCEVAFYERIKDKELILNNKEQFLPSSSTCCYFTEFNYCLETTVDEYCLQFNNFSSNVKHFHVLKQNCVDYSYSVTSQL